MPTGSRKHQRHDADCRYEPYENSEHAGIMNKAAARRQSSTALVDITHLPSSGKLRRLPQPSAAPSAHQVIAVAQPRFCELLVVSDTFRSVVAVDAHVRMNKPMVNRSNSNTPALINHACRPASAFNRSSWRFLNSPRCRNRHRARSALATRDSFSGLTQKVSVVEYPSFFHTLG